MKGARDMPDIDKVHGGPGRRGVPGEEPVGDNIIQALYDFWIQTLRHRPSSIDKGVYLSTFQKGRGQHVTALSTRQARSLGRRLIALADDIEADVSDGFGGGPSRRPGAGGSGGGGLGRP